MNDAPFISVVTPFFQVGGYLREAIESVRAQTYDRWELILVDDGSTDDGPDIAREYAARYPSRIVVLSHPGRANRGISPSRNLGASRARGRWIATLDGDDVWLPDTLAEQARIAEAHPEVGLIMAATLYWRSWAGHASAPDQIIPVGAPQDQVHEPPKLLELLYPLGEGAAPSMNTVLVRSDVLRQVGGWENEFPTAYEDQALLTKLYLATPAYVSSGCWDRYRQRPGSTMDLELRGRNYRLHRYRFLRWFHGYLERQGAPPAIRRRVRTAMWWSRHPVMHKLARSARRIARVFRSRNA